MLTGYPDLCMIFSTYYQRNMAIMMAMDLYSTERNQLDRHQAVVRQAELRSALLPGTGRPTLATWLAGGLRGAADRLDPRASLEAQRPAIIRSLRKPVP